MGWFLSSRPTASGERAGAARALGASDIRGGAWVVRPVVSAPRIGIRQFSGPDRPGDRRLATGDTAGTEGAPVRTRHAPATATTCLPRSARITPWPPARFPQPAVGAGGWAWTRSASFPGRGCRGMLPRRRYEPGAGRQAQCGGDRPARPRVTARAPSAGVRYGRTRRSQRPALARSRNRPRPCPRPASARPGTARAGQRPTGSCTGWCSGSCRPGECAPGHGGSRPRWSSARRWARPISRLHDRQVSVEARSPPAAARPGIPVKL